MIASLRGRVLDVSLTGAVIETGGIGMAFQATPATLSGLRTGEARRASCSPSSSSGRTP